MPGRIPDPGRKPGVFLSSSALFEQNRFAMAVYFVLFHVFSNVKIRAGFIYIAEAVPRNRS